MRLTPDVRRMLRRRINEDFGGRQKDAAAHLNTTETNISRWMRDDGPAYIAKPDLADRLRKFLGFPAGDEDTAHGAALHPCAGKPPWLAELCRQWDEIPDEAKAALRMVAEAAIKKDCPAVQHTRRAKAS